MISDSRNPSSRYGFIDFNLKTPLIHLKHKHGIHTSIIQVYSIEDARLWNDSINWSNRFGLHNSQSGDDAHNSQSPNKAMELILKNQAILVLNKAFSENEIVTLL
ncbi:hypothetical protein L1887_17240 [Cichorium endivia]|nr:hypothetical protein L1887_17240 [Cichorium endivia]